MARHARFGRGARDRHRRSRWRMRRWPAARSRTCHSPTSTWPTGSWASDRSARSACRPSCRFPAKIPVHRRGAGRDRDLHHARSVTEAPPDLALVLREVAADDVEVERPQDRLLRLAFEQEGEGRVDQALGVVHALDAVGEGIGLPDGPPRAPSWTRPRGRAPCTPSRRRPPRTLPRCRSWSCSLAGRAPVRAAGQVGALPGDRDLRFRSGDTGDRSGRRRRPRPARRDRRRS